MLKKLNQPNTTTKQSNYIMHFHINHNLRHLKFNDNNFALGFNFRRIIW